VRTSSFVSFLKGVPADPIPQAVRGDNNDTLMMVHYLRSPKAGSPLLIPSNLRPELSSLFAVSWHGCAVRGAIHVSSRICRAYHFTLADIPAPDTANAPWQFI
jgi:hypothetical protein